MTDEVVEATWKVSPGDAGLWHVALRNENGSVQRWHTVTYDSEGAASDAAAVLNAGLAPEPESVPMPTSVPRPAE